MQQITINPEALAEFYEDMENAQAWRQKIHGTDYDPETRKYSHDNWSVDGERYIGGFLEGRFRGHWAYHFHDAVKDEFYRNHIQTNLTYTDFPEDEREQIDQYAKDLVKYYEGLHFNFEVEQWGSALEAAKQRVKRDLISDRHTIDVWLAWPPIGENGLDTIGRIQLRMDGMRAVGEVLESMSEVAKAA